MVERCVVRGGGGGGGAARRSLRDEFGAILTQRGRDAGRRAVAERGALEGGSKMIAARTVSALIAVAVAL